MRSILFVLAALMTGAAQAAVYHWRTIDHAAIQYAIGGRLVIDDAAPMAFEYEHQPRCWSCSVSEDGLPHDDYSDPNSFVISMSMWSRDNSFDVNYRTGQGWVFYSPDWFTLDRRGTLSGEIYADNGETGVSMHSVGGLWSIMNFSSDRGPICAPTSADSFDCEGVRGRWVLQQVPLPGTLALLGLGALLLRPLRFHALKR